MPQQTITYKNSIINVSIFGKRDKLLICFHGYGENGNSFEPLEKKLGNEYTLIAMDFPFHGKTIWNEGFLMAPDDLLKILGVIIQRIEIVKGRSSEFHVLAFSLGGRIALHMLQSAPILIKKMVLIAP